jgi:hypothetical protein
VVVNVSELRCDALVVEPTGIRHLPLPQLSARELARRLLGLWAREVPGWDEADGRDRGRTRDGLDDDWDVEMTDLLAWLWRR